MSCITIAHQCGPFLESLIRDQLTGSLMRLGRAVCVCILVCLYACGRVFMYLCARAFTSLSQLHPLFTDSLRVFIFHTHTQLWLRHYSINTEKPLIAAVSSACNTNTPQKSKKAAHVAGTCGCWGGF